MPLPVAETYVSVTLLRMILEGIHVSKKRFAEACGYHPVTLNAMLSQRDDYLSTRAHPRLLDGCDKLGIPREFVLITPNDLENAPDMQDVMRRVREVMEKAG